MMGNGTRNKQNRQVGIAQNTSDDNRMDTKTASI